MTPPPHEEPRAPEESGEGLQRAALAPGLLLGGAILLGRVEVLARLAVSERGVDPELAAWAASAEWQPLAIQALILGAVAASFAFGAGKGRRLLGFVLASAVVLSGLTGWPLAPVRLIPSPSELGPLVAFSTGAGLLLTLLAQGAEARASLRRALGGAWSLGALGLFGFLLPAGWVARRATHAPTFPVREVVRELVTERRAFEVLRARQGAEPRLGVLSPFPDLLHTNHALDTGDKPALLMPPPCEVVFVHEGDEPVGLVTAVQIDGQVSNRGFDPELGPGARPSLMELGGQDHIAVRFEVLVDGELAFESVVHHVPGQSAEERTWRHVGTDGSLSLLPGARVVLRTSFADEATREYFARQPFDCGFGDLVLERWEQRARRRASAEAPNLVLCVMDTLRADRMSCYGYSKPTTPHLDALAARGTLFEGAYSTASWTWPSTASILTGLLPYEHGVLSNRACNLNLEYETLAEALQGRGYTTAAVSCNPLVNKTTHFDQGFERFDEGVTMRMSDEVIDDIERTLDEVADTRFFLYLQLVDPHTPHRPLASELERLGGEEPADFPDIERFGVELDGLDHYAGRLASGEGEDPDGTPHPERVIPEAHRRWLHDRYDASVGTGDHYVGRVLARLRELGLEENTVVVFTSDHGEELLDHDGLAHGHALWRELVHVPLLVAGPGVPRGARVSTEVSNRHIAPTLAMLGGAALEGAGDGLNLLAPELAAEPIFYQTSKGTWKGARKHLELLGARRGDFVTHYAPKGAPRGEEPGELGDARLFDRAADPHERTDLALDPARRPLALPEVQALRKSWSEQKQRKRGRSIGAGSSGKNMLVGVGYLDGPGTARRPDEDEETQDSER